MKYQLNGDQDIKVVVAKAVKDYQKGRRGVQNASVLVLIHAAKHGDYSQSQILCDGVGSKSLVEWFKDFGGLVVEGDKFVGWSGADHIRDNFEQAKAQMYWEYKAVNIWGGQDDLKAAKALVTKHKAAEKIVSEDATLLSKAKFDTVLIAEIEAAIEKAEERAA